MAYTLADFSRLAESPLKKAVIDIFRKESMMLDLLSFETTGTLNIEFMRTKTLPTITARNIGGAYTESKGTTENLAEQVCLLGAYIDVPKEYVKAKNQIVNQRALQTQMFVTSLAYKFNDMFINGVPTSNPKEMVGIWYRLQNDLAAAQNINASGIDISSDSGTLSAAQAALVDSIEQLIHACEGHKCDVLLMNSTTYLRLLAALRAKNYYASTKDSFGRSLPTFGEGGPKIIDLGTKADQTTLIMPNTETAAGTALTGGTLTSIYALRLGEQQFVNGWQFDPIETTDIGLLESGVSYRTIIDWGVGMYFYNPRSMARLYNIQSA